MAKMWAIQILVTKGEEAENILVSKAERQCTGQSDQEERLLTQEP